MVLRSFCSVECLQKDGISEKCSYAASSLFCSVQVYNLCKQGSEKILLDLTTGSDWNLVIFDPCFLHPVAVIIHHHPHSCEFVTLYCIGYPVSLKCVLSARKRKQAFHLVGFERGKIRKTFACFFFFFKKKLLKIMLITVITGREGM